MKIQMFKAAILSTAVAALGFSAAANAATTSGTARARILQPLTITQAAELNFGTIITGTAGNVTVSTAGVRSTSGPTLAGGTVAAGAFNLTGSNVIVDVSVDASVSLTNGTGGTMSAGLSTSAPTVTLVANAGSFTVSGVLAVAAAQPDGVYTGTYTATANYQ